MYRSSSEAKFGVCKFKKPFKKKIKAITIVCFTYNYNYFSMYIWKNNYKIAL